jgi:hypothetical protein
MKTFYHLVLIAGLVIATTANIDYNVLVDDLVDDLNEAPRPTPILETPSLARELGVGLAPTRSPISQNPAIRPSANPTDRTKKPTLPPTRAPTTLIPTRYPCSLCNPGESPFDPLATILFNGKLVTCESVHALGDLTAKGGQDMCDFYHSIGQTVCDCRKGTSPPVNTCTLCEDGSALPYPNWRVIGQLKCSTIQDGARGDVPAKCERYQSAMGYYCGCKNPITTPKFCHLCNTTILPFPKRVVNGKTCLEHQFLATIRRTCIATKSKVASACCAA